MLRVCNAPLQERNAMLRVCNATLHERNATLRVCNVPLHERNATLRICNAPLHEDNATFLAGKMASPGADGVSGGAGGRRSEAGRASAPASGTPALPENSPAIHGWVNRSTKGQSPGWDERKCAGVSAVPAGT